MKLTKDYLRKIIKEEYSRYLNEQEKEQDFIVPVGAKDKRIFWNKESIQYFIDSAKSDEEKSKVVAFSNSEVRDLLEQYNCHLNVTDNEFQILIPRKLRTGNTQTRYFNLPRGEIFVGIKTYIDGSGEEKPSIIIKKIKGGSQVILSDDFPGMGEDLIKIINLVKGLREGRIKTIEL